MSLNKFLALLALILVIVIGLIKGVSAVVAVAFIAVTVLLPLYLYALLLKIEDNRAYKISSLVIVPLVFVSKFMHSYNPCSGFIFKPIIISFIFAGFVALILYVVYVSYLQKRSNYKFLYEASDLNLANYIQGYLANHSIEVIIDAKSSISNMGISAPSINGVNILIKNRSQILKAKELIGRALEEIQSGSDWLCPDCQEHIEAQFTECWKCGKEYDKKYEILTLRTY